MGVEPTWPGGRGLWGRSLIRRSSYPQVAQAGLEPATFAL